MDINTLKLMVKGAVADRKGATAIEYALIAAAVAGVVIVAFRSMFTRLSEFLATVTFTS